MTRLALDKSLRHYDADGHLHVEKCNISKANVCPYYGREIPDYEKLGLEPERVYRLYRDPEELRKAASTFANKPLLIHHLPVHADAPSQELVVGTVGTTVEFEHPYLRAPISAWTREAIDAIETGEQEQLSSAYRYRADMTPGTSPDGVAYDGRMCEIEGNHVALVAEGRAGPDVVVADEKPHTMKFPRITAALSAILGTTVTPAQMVALDSAMTEELKGEDAKTAKDSKRRAAEDKRRTAEDRRRAAEDKRRAAEDAKDTKAAEDAKREAMDATKSYDEAQREYEEATADESPLAPPDTSSAAHGQAKATGMDAAAVQLAIDAAVKGVHAVYTARAAVESKVGTVALDSAEAVYRYALGKLEVDHKAIAADALPALWDATLKAQAAAPIAQDATAACPSVAELFPGFSHIRKG